LRKKAWDSTATDLSRHKLSQAELLRKRVKLESKHKEEATSLIQQSKQKYAQKRKEQELKRKQKIAKQWEKRLEKRYLNTKHTAEQETHEVEEKQEGFHVDQEADEGEIQTSGDENEVAAADPAEMEFLDNELLTLEKKFKNFEAKVKGQLKSQSEKVNQNSEASLKEDVLLELLMTKMRDQENQTQKVEEKRSLKNESKLRDNEDFFRGVIQQQHDMIMSLKKQVDTLTVRFDSMCTQMEVLTTQITGKIVNTSLSKPLSAQFASVPRTSRGATIQFADPIPKTFLSDPITTSPYFSSMPNRNTNDTSNRIPDRIPEYFANLTNLEQNPYYCAQPFITPNRNKDLIETIDLPLENRTGIPWPEMPPHNFHQNIADAMFPNPEKCQSKPTISHRSFIPSDPLPATTMDFNLPSTYFSSQQLTTLNLTNNDPNLQIGVVGRKINNNSIELAERVLDDHRFAEH